METLSLEPRKVESFWAKVDKSGDCWMWTASIGNGYGQFWVAVGQRYRAHRVAYMLTKGGIPEESVIDHMCHNKACVNPSHLRAVTVKQNIENRIGANKNSKSGIRGVSWDKQSSRWIVQVGHKGRIHRGGSFKSVKDAEKCAVKLRLRLFTHSDTDKAVRSGKRQG